MYKLHRQFPNVAGLEPPGLGSCVEGKSLPRFVQMVNVGDHWICLTNVFATDVNDIFVYNSLISSDSLVPYRTVLQASSLVRGYADLSGTVRLHVGDLQQQSKNTRLCGYYAVAAAIACCHKVDPTGCNYDKSVCGNKSATYCRRMQRMLYNQFLPFQQSDSPTFDALPKTNCTVSVTQNIATYLARYTPGFSETTAPSVLL